MLRTCECGCGESMEGRRRQARYASDACRARAWHEKHAAEAVSTVQTVSAARMEFFQTVEKRSVAKHSARLVILGLAFIADPVSRRAVTTVSELASLSRLSRRGVQGALRSLEAAGEVENEGRVSRHDHRTRLRITVAA